MTPSDWLCTRLGASCLQLWENEMLLDCTVACPYGKIMAHKIVLSAASNYLMNLLHENKSDHPMLILDTSLDCLKDFMRYVYYGILPPEENEEFFELASKLMLHSRPEFKELRTRAEPAAGGSRAPERALGGSRAPAPALGGSRTPAPAAVGEAAESAPSDTPRRRRGRPRKTAQVARQEDEPPPAPAGPGGAPPKEVNVRVVHTLEQPPVAGGAVAGRGRSAVLARAGVPERLFGAASPAGLAATAGVPDRLFGPVPTAPAAGGAPSPQREDATGAAAESEPDDWEPTAEPAGDSSGADSGAETKQERRLRSAAASDRPARATASSVQCGYCGKMCCNKETLKVHRRTHTDERPYACPVAECGAAFRQRVHLRRHAQLLHDAAARPAKHSCPSCKRVFRHEAGLERHRQQWQRQGRLCRPAARSGGRPSAAARFACTLCDKKFAARGAFDDHVRVHTNQRPFVCSVCQKGFKQKSHLTEHERIHTGQKPFKCSVCSLSFYNRSRFKMHQVQHVNEALLLGKEPPELDPKNKFPACSVCFKRFINASNLRLHERSHSNEKPHQCHLCSKRFKLAKTLTKHLEAHALPEWDGEEPEEEEEEGDGEGAETPGALPVDGEGVIVLREEEDGSLTYVPALQQADADGRVVQVMLSEAEAAADAGAADQLMADSGDISSKWVAASVQEMLPAAGAADETEPPPPAALLETDGADH
ncbi:zinc finger and SCAN domain-containing protein 10-like isoform X1 [Amphibalanus amphitrite]|uniref:zinc finger and SCAN domain-containing protein 10-like isoform X1 n=2 Tax=Amphibalanus amphitrite TaxID=1232801 RepID=UPI001C9208FE|nr:zinc finger and SCAN domain-containing protein 10-like isoform X1 [Amphibalanus amphitrite]XP_043214364.1 zinc finger and SCAN domain-containing protein 10-like isoform X1 [Amphibalanus amphitrite]XP_043214373.1 zinc finger and SCAN domain-containing protein 10-like isoform X1 [Amphibalanus amphitrite]